MSKKTNNLLTVLITILIAASAWGLVYQPEDYNDVPDANWSGWPNSNFMAMINDHRHVAPTTVIAPNFIITAGHVYCASGVEGDRVKIGNTNSYDYIVVDHRSEGGCSPYPDLTVYRIKKLEWIDPNDPNHPTEPNDANDSTYGMLKDAELDTWVDLYNVNNYSTEYSELRKIIYVGSYGPQRVSEDVDINAPIKKSAGSLHWGRNVVTLCTSSGIGEIYNKIGQGDYVEYEVFGGGYDSGAGWLIKDGIEWKIAGFYSGPTSGPRIMSYIEWIDNKIADMGGTRPLPNVDIYWTGDVNDN